MIRIASVTATNKPILQGVFQQHNMQHRFDPYPDQSGYHVFVNRNHELYFREVIAPEYKAALHLNYSGVMHEYFGN